jgi:thiol-disulfide isomerase/thioredoxin
MSERDAQALGGDVKKSVKTVNSVEEYEAAMREAKGPVIVDFVAQDCGWCDESKPHVDKLAKGCDVTVLRVDVDAVGALADKFDVSGTPTTLYAPTAADMQPGKAEEVDPEDKSFRAKLKCARTKGGSA